MGLSILFTSTFPTTELPNDQVEFKYLKTCPGDNKPLKLIKACVLVSQQQSLRTPAKILHLKYRLQKQVKQNKRGWLKKLFGMENSSVRLNGCPEIEILNREKEKKLCCQRLQQSMEQWPLKTNQHTRKADFLLSSKELPGHLLIKDFMWGLRRQYLEFLYAEKQINHKICLQIHKSKLASTMAIKYTLQATF